MRLLNTTSLQFQEFFDEQRPKYAILSHRWGSDETSFKDFSKGRKQDSEGHQKILSFCEFAKARGHEWVWADTCKIEPLQSHGLLSPHLQTSAGCIDKSSSAELSEAINSMFRWYFDSDTCYAYLSDVNPTADYMDSFRKSNWFTRGWTPQELLAPAQVKFCDAQWNVFCDKRSKFHTISKFTHIEPEYLVGRGLAHTASIATRMAWASRRKTTRKEDVAYCMLGIFEINMPLLYGEGDKAFLRLQAELVRKSNDQSILAWHPVTTVFNGGHMLALSPRDFAYSANLRVSGDRGLTYGVTQRGLELRVAREAWITHPRERKVDLGFHLCEFRLDCEESSDGTQCVPCIVMCTLLSQNPKWENLWERKHVRMRPVQEIRTLPKPAVDVDSVTTLLAAQAIA